MKELINLIITDEELSVEEKSDLVIKMINVSHGFDGEITPGFYLRANRDNKTGELGMELWYRNTDENGMTDHGPTNYTIDRIYEMLKSECINHKEKTR